MLWRKPDTFRIFFIPPLVSSYAPSCQDYVTHKKRLNSLLSRELVVVRGGKSGALDNYLRRYKGAGYETSIDRREPY